MEYKEIKTKSRELRKNSTEAEDALWNEVRNRKPCGRKFLRQHPFIYGSNKGEHFFFVADFYCAEEKLVIEVDGKVHDSQKDKGGQRDEILKYLGLRVLRIENEELGDIEKVKSKIVEVLNKLRYSPPAPL
jgi:very-short-patch-repair endonuclease